MQQNNQRNLHRMNLIIAAGSESTNLQYWWVPLVSALFGGSLSLCGSFGAIFFAERAKRDSERKRLAATLAGELQGILEYLNTQQIEELLNAAAQSSARPNVERIPPLRGSFLGASGKIDESIGLLPSHVAADSSSIVVHLRGTVEEFTAVRNAWADKGRWNDQEVRDYCKQLAGMVKICKDRASQLIPELRKEAEMDREP